MNKQPDPSSVLLSTEQLQKRIGEMARQISADYRGQRLHVVGVLENAFIFMADLVRALDLEVVCQFVKPTMQQTTSGNTVTTEIFYIPELEVQGHPVLLVEALVESGITAEFLMRNLLARGAASVKLATLLDRQGSRRISLQPDYFGFLIDESFVSGYGLGTPDVGRNIPYIATRRPAEAAATP